MDLSELIKCYNMEHKSLFTAFAVSFPVLFTVLYLYIPEFANLEFYEQVVFSATASIFCVYISYLFTVIVYRAGRERYRRGHLPLLICTLAASFWLIVFPNNYGLGYRYVIYVFSDVYIYFYGILALGASVVGIFRLFPHRTKNLKERIEKTETKENDDK
jgi:hypothetical protein